MSQATCAQPAPAPHSLLGMSRENVEVVRELFERYRRGDHAGAVECLAPDVVYEVGQELPALGPAAVLEMWQRWESDWEEIDAIPEEYLDAGDRVVVSVRYLARGRGGIEIDDRLFDVYVLRDGKCVGKREFRSRSDALDEAGLAGAG